MSTRYIFISKSKVLTLQLKKKLGDITLNNQIPAMMRLMDSPPIISQEKLSIISVVALLTKAVFLESNPDGLPNGIKKKLWRNTN